MKTKIIIHQHKDCIIVPNNFDKLIINDLGDDIINNMEKPRVVFGRVLEIQGDDTLVKEFLTYIKKELNKEVFLI